MRTLQEIENDIKKSQFNIYKRTKWCTEFIGRFGIKVVASKDIGGIFFDHSAYFETNLLKLFIEYYEVWLQEKETYRLGDIECVTYECEDCPLRWLCDTCTPKIRIDNDTTLYEVLESFEIMDTDFYKLLKTKLDKVVE